MVLIQFSAQWKQKNLNTLILLCKLQPPPHPENKSDLKHRPVVLCPCLRLSIQGCATPEQSDNTTTGRKIGFTGKDSLILDSDTLPAKKRAMGGDSAKHIGAGRTFQVLPDVLKAQQTDTSVPAVKALEVFSSPPAEY